MWPFPKKESKIRTAGIKKLSYSKKKGSDYLKSYAKMMAMCSENIWLDKLHSNKGIFKIACKCENINILGPTLTDFPEKIKKDESLVTGDMFSVESFFFFSKASEEQKIFYGSLLKKNPVRSYQYLLEMIGSTKFWEERIYRLVGAYRMIKKEEEIILQDGPIEAVKHKLRIIEDTEEKEEKKDIKFLKRFRHINIFKKKTLSDHIKHDIEQITKNPINIIEWDENARCIIENHLKNLLKTMPFLFPEHFKQEKEFVHIKNLDKLKGIKNLEDVKQKARFG